MRDEVGVVDQFCASSAVGTFRTWSDVRLESVVRIKADSADYYGFMDSRPN
jgi:hypothetical protein